MKILDKIKNNGNVKYFSNVNKGIKPFLIDELQEEYKQKKILVILKKTSYILFLFVDSVKSKFK